MSTGMTSSTNKNPADTLVCLFITSWLKQPTILPSAHLAWSLTKSTFPAILEPWSREVGILQDARVGLKTSQPESVHGSLLEFLLDGRMVRSRLQAQSSFLMFCQFMKKNSSDTTEQLLQFKAHHNLCVRKIVVTLVPTFAVYNTQTFTEHHLHNAMVATHTVGRAFRR